MDKARTIVNCRTIVHGVGSLVVFGMAVYVLVRGTGEPLAVTPGGRQLVDWTGPLLPVFFVALGLFLGFLAWGSHHRQPWSWPAALAAYGVGVVGSTIELVAGYPQYAASVLINGLVVTALLAPSVRHAFKPLQARDSSA